MSTPTEKYLTLAQAVIDGQTPDTDTLQTIASLPDDQVFDILPGANLIRTTFFKNEVQLCNICNGKSGKCSEDCSFCSQSQFYDTHVETYPLLSEEELKKRAKELKATPHQPIFNCYLRKRATQQRN